MGILMNNIIIVELYNFATTSKKSYYLFTTDLIFTEFRKLTLHISVYHKILDIAFLHKNYLFLYWFSDHLYNIYIFNNVDSITRSRIYTLYIYCTLLLLKLQELQV